MWGQQQPRREHRQQGDKCLGALGLAWETPFFCQRRAKANQSEPNTNSVFVCYIFEKAMHSVRFHLLPHSDSSFCLLVLSPQAHLWCHRLAQALLFFFLLFLPRIPLHLRWYLYTCSFALTFKAIKRLRKQEKSAGPGAGATGKHVFLIFLASPFCGSRFPGFFTANWLSIKLWCYLPSAEVSKWYLTFLLGGEPSILPKIASYL